MSADVTTAPTPLFPPLISSAWRQRLRELYPNVEPSLDASVPHPNFRYPTSPVLAGDAERTAEKLRDVLSPRHVPGTHLRFHADPLRALLHYTKRRGLAPGFRLLMQPLAPTAFFEAARRLNARVVLLPRDPEEWDAFDFANFDECWLSNPSATDGFFYPETFYLRLAQHLAPHKTTHVLSEEGTGVFSFNEVAPGSFRELLLDPRVTLLSSAWPCYQPLGPQLAWTITTHEDERGADAAPASAELQGALLANLPVIRALQARQGAAYQEVARRLLAVEQGLRLFGDDLKPLLTSRRLPPLSWPETGFFMLFDASLILRERAIDIETLCLRLFEEHGVVVEPGTAFGAPQAFRVCYAAPHGTLLRLARALREAFLKA